MNVQSLTKNLIVTADNRRLLNKIF